jgi:hypothetical protein
MFVFVISSCFIAKFTLCEGHKHYVAHPPSAEFSKVFCFTAAEIIKILTNAYNDINEVQHPNNMYVCLNSLNK